jgi:hypothetical protein
MQKFFRFIVLAGVLLLASCNKDEITTVVAGDGENTENYDIDTTADRTVTVAFSTSGDAVVGGAGNGITATVDGNDVTITNTGSQKVFYSLSGSTNDGFLKIYSGRKQSIELNGVSITNTRGAAINVQGLPDTPNKGKRVDLILNGSSTLADGATYSLTPSDEDEKAALFSEGQIVVSGSGSLTVSASGKSGIATDDWLCINDGTITVNSSSKTFVSNGDTTKVSGVKAKDAFIISGGALNITCSGIGAKGISGDSIATFAGGTVNITVTGSNFGSSGGGWPGGGGHGGGNNDNSVAAKGIKFDGNIEIVGGKITVVASNHEGIESKGTLTVAGGEVYSQSSDDAINSAGDMTISGGYVCAYSTGNDGIDANGNIYLQGGVVYAIGKTSPEMAIDANTEGGKKLYIQGGTIIALGNLESGAQLSQACYQASSWTKNVWYSIVVGDNTYAFKTPSSGGQKLVVSGSSQPAVKSSVSVSGGTERCNAMLIEAPEVSGGNNVSLSTYTGGGWH